MNKAQIAARARNAREQFINIIAAAPCRVCIVLRRKTRTTNGNTINHYRVYIARHNDERTHDYTIIAAAVLGLTYSKRHDEMTSSTDPIRLQAWLADRTGQAFPFIIFD